MELQQFFHENNSHLRDAVLPVLSGCATFGATLALSTAVQKLVGVSTATKILPSLNGVFTVCAASLASERAAILAHQWQRHPTGSIGIQQIQSKVFATSSQVVNLSRRASSSKPHQQLQQFQQEQAERLRDGIPLTKRNSHGSSLDGSFDCFKQLPMHELRV